LPRQAVCAAPNESKLVNAEPSDRFRNRGVGQPACVGAAALILATTLGFHTVAATIGDTPNVLRVLYIGNSLTIAHDIPGLVGALGASRGLEIVSRVVAFGNYSLEDHWNRGDASRAIAEGGWSIVVLQQGPSALPESQVLLRAYTRRFDQQINRIGARTALYMVWPAADRRTDFDGVIRSYAAAAREVGGLLLPVGEAWRTAWRRDEQLELYSADGFHPSPLGAYLAALVIYQQLSGRSPIGLPSTFERIFVPPSRAALLQEAAAEANARPGR
jgi:hypothetical protein